MKLNLSNKTVLIIEDYPAMRKSIKDMLHTLGVQYIFEAENGMSAISAMKKQKFDIILCDYQLGAGKNGQQILEEAKFNKLIPFNTLFIIVTAHQTASFVLSTIENKPDEYLTKPFNAQQLYRRIEKSFLRKELFSTVEEEIDNENLAKAIFNCDALLAKNNKAIHSHLLKLRADLAINVGDFETAATIYQEALEQRELSWARLGTGVIAFFKDDYDFAINIFQSLIDQTPMLMECYDWLTKSYVALEQYSDAELTLSRATAISPHSFLRQKKLALIADKTGNIDVAEKAYKTITEIGEFSIHKSPSDFSGLAKVYSKKHKNKEALSVLEKLRQVFTNNTEAELRATVLETAIFQELGDNKLADQAYQQINSLLDQIQDTAPKDLQLDIAKSYYLNDDKKTADNIINFLIHNHIDDNSFLGDIRQMQSDIGQDNYSEVLIQQTKQELLSINNKGVGLFQQGQINEAYELFEQAVKTMPNNKAIILNMATITLHKLKTSGITEENLLLTHRYIKRAKELGVAIDKVGNLQLEFEKTIHTHPSLL